MPFNAVLIGQGPLFIACAEALIARQHPIALIVSDCPEVSAWAQKKGTPRILPGEDIRAALGAAPFDYLFSIVNHAITSSDVLALPRLGAFNYHDSPLPAYGGFNATTWALLDNQPAHGITWHRMSEAVDGGSIAIQKRFTITDDDTAFSLSMRAADAAKSAFLELIEALESGTLTETPAKAAENFHKKSARPAPLFLTKTTTVSDALRQVRALDFGATDSWLTHVKVLSASGRVLAIAGAQKATASGAPGTVLSVADGQLSLALADGAVTLTVTTLEGDALPTAHLSQLGFQNGSSISGPSPELTEHLQALDQDVTQVERSWVSRLATQQPIALRELSVFGADGQEKSAGAVDVLTAPWTGALQTIAHSARAAQLLAAVSAYVMRVGDDVSRVHLGLVSEAVTSNELSALYAPVVPLALSVTNSTTRAELLTQAQTELESAAKKQTYAKDVWTRYRGLQGRSPASRHLALAINLTEGMTALPDGVRALFEVNEDALTLRFDTSAISRVHATRLLDRVRHLMTGLTQEESQTVGTLSLVTPEEERLLLETFQQTSRPAVKPACIHTLFAEQVARTPDKTAVVFKDKTLTYRQLNEKANALAAALTALGAGPDGLVAISVERSLEMVVSLLGVLKAGAAYVPLDPAYPKERLSIMLEDSGAKLLVTESKLQGQLPSHNAQVVLVDQLGPINGGQASQGPTPAVTPDNLAYVIFTSGSTGRPKGVMIEHRHAANFFAGMDERVGPEPGIWLAVTSISFDISVLELLWTLTRGFEVVVQEEGDRASLLKAQSQVKGSSRPMGFGLFYFAADSSEHAGENPYRLMLEGAKFADKNDFCAVWTPERHFHAFGGLYPNPAVTSAAIAAVTEKIALRAGSVVIPLHDPIRVAEEWAVVDNLSNGRVGLSFASGWHANDFALQPQNYERRREIMSESIETVLKLWAGDKVSVKNGTGEMIEVSVLPRPVNARPPMWIASAGNIDTFKRAGTSGHNILTNMLGQDVKDLGEKFAAYREARQEAGHQGDGIISVMLHTFVTDSDEKAKELARRPFGNYLKSSYDLVKVAPWMFPAFKQPSLEAGGDTTSAFDPTRFDDADMDALLDHAFERYFDTAGLFGTPERALALVEKLKDIGATEVACLIDFGINPSTVLENLTHLDALRRLANPSEASAALEVSAPVSIAEQFERRAITHFQCTPSMARMLTLDGTLAKMTSLSRFLVGGEALPVDLATTIKRALSGTQLLNMYGPTETTVWSSTETIEADQDITIGTPIANTQIRILDSNLELLPLGCTGELCIGGASVVRGYLGRKDLTDERFVTDPYLKDNRLYRTGDLARFLDDGRLEYIGRIDQQVKFSGYRIELGEIETVLSRHPQVKEAVVAVKKGAVGDQLIGYVVPSGSADEASGVDDWEKRWDEAYEKRTGASDAPARFDTSGWLDSFSGAPTSTEVMREWLDTTLERISAEKPRRVLEIGCGTGMILYGCLESVEHYTAVDVSPHALETIRNELSSEERQKTTLIRSAAHDVDFPAGSFDMVIINSVAQYFPNEKYLEEVLARVSQSVVDGGVIFLGDIRSLEEARHFHTLVELEKSPGSVDGAELSRRIQERAELDTELLVGGAFFSSLEKAHERLSVKSIQMKTGFLPSEMRDFRSDVVISVGKKEAPLTNDQISLSDSQDPLATLKELGESAPAVQLFRGIQNSRLSSVLAVSQRLERGDTGLSADSLRSSLGATSPAGVSPSSLFALDDYSVELRFGERPGTFDALVRRPGAPAARWAPPTHGALASTPHKRSADENLLPKLTSHVKEFLPTYMVPSAFVVLESFPLTPNGKIDKKALPLPEAAPRKTTEAYAVPSSDLEKSIAGIWKDMLGVDRVGRKDNIFDLGASSLITVEANNRLQSLLGKKIPLVTMFRYPTVESLATHLGASGTQGAPSPVQAPALDAGRQDRMSQAAERRRRARAQAP